MLARCGLRPLRAAPAAASFKYFFGTMRPATVPRRVLRRYRLDGDPDEGADTFMDTRTADIQEKLTDFANRAKEAYERANKTQAVFYTSLGALVLWVLSSTDDAVHRLPLMPQVLQLVGLWFSTWFFFRHVLWAEDRRKLKSHLQAMVKQQPDQFLADAAERARQASRRTEEGVEAASDAIDPSREGSEYGNMMHRPGENAMAAAADTTAVVVDAGARASNAMTERTDTWLVGCDDEWVDREECAKAEHHGMNEETRERIAQAQFNKAWGALDKRERGDVCHCYSSELRAAAAREPGDWPDVVEGADNVSADTDARADVVAGADE